MAAMIELQGTITDAAGVGRQGATVEAFDAGTTAPVRGTTTTDGSGDWDLSLDDGSYDVRISAGEDVLWYRYSDQVQLTTLQAHNILAKGSFSFPALTTAQRDMLTTSADTPGLTIFNTTETKTQTWNGTAWEDVGSGSGGAALSDDAPEDVGTAAAGTGTEASRDDHVHGGGTSGVSLSDDDPAAVGSAAAEGTGAEASRDDHVHVGVQAL